MIYSEDELDGEGLKDFINTQADRVKGFFRGTRLDYPPQERSLIKAFGDSTITGITIGRAPINSKLDTFLNVLSLGVWGKLKKDYEFDKLFHLYMIITLSNGKMLRIEKNQVIKISTNVNTESDAEFEIVPLQGKQITLKEFLQNAVTKYGDNRIFIYSPWSTNCQQYLVDLLEANNLLTDKTKKFIYQDMKELVEKLPGYVKKFGQGTTDLAHRFDILIHGQGFEDED